MKKALGDNASEASTGDPLTADGGVRKQVLRKATLGEMPPDGALVKVHYEGFLQLSGVKFDSSRERGQPFEFKLGVGQVISAWDIGIKSMCIGEVARISCRSDYGYGWEGSPPKIPSDALLTFDVELIDWRVPVKDASAMSQEEVLGHAAAKREEGVQLFKAGQFSNALTCFCEGDGYLSSLPRSVRNEADASETLLSCLLNAAQCALKLSEWNQAVSICTRVLVMDAKNVKAVYRRGLAYSGLERYKDAMPDLLQACKLEPKSREIRGKYESVKAAATETQRSAKEAFGGMFQ